MLLVSSEIYPFMASDGYSIYNLSSLCMDPSIPRLNILPPNRSVNSWMSGVEYQFDQQYADLLMNDNTMFVQLMQIVKDLYFGINVVLLVYREQDVFDPLTESLCKFIQQRYGYNYQLLNIADDFNPNDMSTFSVGGIMNFDLDNSRYIALMQSINPDYLAKENISAMNGYIV